MRRLRSAARQRLRDRATPRGTARARDGRAPRAPRSAAFSADIAGAAGDEHVAQDRVGGRHGGRYGRGACADAARRRARESATIRHRPSSAAPVQAPLLTTELASRFAPVALANIGTEYPNKPDHVLGRPDICGPRASSIPPSSAASTGTRACTCTGCSRACAGWCPTCRSAPGSPRCSTGTSSRPRSPPSARTSRGRRPHRSSVRTAGRGCSKLAPSSLADDDRDARRWSRALRRSPTRSRNAFATGCRAPTIRYATACTRTARSASLSRSTMRGRRRERARGGVRRARAGVVRRRSRRAGGVGALRRRLPVARARSRPT